MRPVMASYGVVVDNQELYSFDKLEEKIDRKIDGLGSRLEVKINSLDGKVNGIESRMAVMESGFHEMRTHQANLSIDLRDLRGSLDTKFLWIVSTMIGFGVALLAAMAEGFHWVK
jgi:hypothetical protein